MDAEKAKLMLRQCRTLSDAEAKLTALKPMPSRAFRWGLWDGWEGWRPCSTSGLFMEHVESGETRLTQQETYKDYKEGYEVGKKLSMDECLS